MQRASHVLLVLVVVRLGCTARAFSSRFPSRTRRRAISLQSAAPAQESMDTADRIDTTDNNFLFWDDLSQRIATTLLEGDRKRDTGLDGASTGWTSWVEATSAQALQDCLDRMQLLPGGDWSTWLQSSPEPLIVELSTHLRESVARGLETMEWALEEDEEGNTIEDLCQRVSCRLYALPSGSSLGSYSLRTPPGGMIYGNLLAGGVTRFRLLGSEASNRPRRRAGERSLIVSSDGEVVPSWLQYGGPERNYEALDIGSCVFIETTLLPKGLSIPLLSKDEAQQGMTLSSFPWSPRDFLVRGQTKEEIEQAKIESGQLVPKNNNVQVCDLESSFCTSVGGLQPQVEQIVRRVLDGRVVRSASDNAGPDETASQVLDQIRKEEMLGLLDLGLQPVRGLLLYGPPGCGKTALAREISTILDARAPKIVAAPELLDRWVGGSEKLVRDLFSDAEAELDACQGDPTKSALHVVVIDEIDAVFRRRSPGEGSAEVTRASAVNQILSKLDGIQSLGNVLVIGMTNRKELLDQALLRPGRLEVHVEIPLPTKEGRREILAIQFGALRARGRLSQPLCRALDGTKSGHDELSFDGEDEESSFFRFRGNVLGKGRIRDLAADRWTGGWSGADIAGLVRSAGSIALARIRDQGGTVPDDLLITVEDVREALKEVKQ